MFGGDTFLGLAGFPGRAAVQCGAAGRQGALSRRRPQPTWRQRRLQQRRHAVRRVVRQVTAHDSVPHGLPGATHAWAARRAAAKAAGRAVETVKVWEAGRGGRGRECGVRRCLTTPAAAAAAAAAAAPKLLVRLMAPLCCHPDPPPPPAHPGEARRQTGTRPDHPLHTRCCTKQQEGRGERRQE